MKTGGKISFAQARELLDTEPEIRFFDVREEEEYVTGHADGAQLFPLGSIDEQSAAEAIPSPDTPVLVYCRSGARGSERHALRLRLPTAFHGKKTSCRAGSFLLYKGEKL